MRNVHLPTLPSEITVLGTIIMATIIKNTPVSPKERKNDVEIDANENDGKHDSIYGEPARL